MFGICLFLFFFSFAVFIMDIYPFTCSHCQTFSESPFSTWKSAVSILPCFPSCFFPFILNISFLLPQPSLSLHPFSFLRADSFLDIRLRLNECLRLCTHKIHTRTLSAEVIITLLFSFDLFTRFFSPPFIYSHFQVGKIITFPENLPRHGIWCLWKLWDVH